MPDLANYFQQKLIGGPGAFVMTAYDYTDFARAIREKLAREMSTSPVAMRANQRPLTQLIYGLQWNYSWRHGKKN